MDSLAQASSDAPASGASSGKLAAALAHADYGFCIFPLIPNDKRPLIENWRNLATNDKVTIKDWWGGTPDANIGISTDGLLVVDVDPRNDGDASFRRLVEEGGLLGDEFPPTLAAGTQGGGTHIFYWRMPGATLRNSASLVGKGIDIKTDGGYVVGAGSTIEGRPYYWKGGYEPNKREFALAPAWLVERCNVARPKSADAGKVIVLEDEVAVHACRQWLQSNAPQANIGERGYTAYKVACRFYDYGVAKDTCIELLTEWSEENCEAPMDGADIEHAAHSALRNRDSAIGSKHPNAPGFDEIEVAPRNPIHKPVTSTTAPAGGWGLLGDPWAETTLPPDLDLDLLPPAVARWVSDIADRTGTIRGAAATAGLTMFSAAISAQWRVQVKQSNTRHSVCSTMWAMTSGQPGSRKSPVNREAREPLEEIEAEWAKQNEIDRRRHATASAAHKQRVKAGDQTAVEPEPPRERRKIIFNTTTEKAGLVAKDNPQGFMVFSDELDGWLASMDTYRSGSKSSVDGAFYLTARDGGSYSYDRIGRESFYVPVLAISILGSIQPEVLSKLVTTWSSNGLLQRFALVNMPQARPAEDREPDEEASRIVKLAVRKIVEMGEGLSFNAPPVFRFAPNADRFRQEITTFAQAVVSDPDTPMPVRGWSDKMEDLWARVALTMHVSDYATRSAKDAPLSCDLIGDVFSETLPPLVISSETAECAARYVLDFLFPHQQHFYKEVAGLSVEEDNAARRVASYILRNRLDAIDDRALQINISKLRGTDGDAKNRRASAMSALDLLGWVHPAAHHPTTGRVIRWNVNPTVHDGRFASVTRTEAARCERARELIAKSALERREEKARKAA